MYAGCRGRPYVVGELDELPSARELSWNIVKLPEAVAYRLLGYKKVKKGDQTFWEKKNEGRVTMEGTVVKIDGQPIYDRIKGAIDADE